MRAHNIPLKFVTLPTSHLIITFVTIVIFEFCTLTVDRSLLPKINELRALCSAYHPSVVCLNETWLCPDVEDNELLIPNYTIVRLDRNRHGGGVAMFINNSLSVKVLLHGPMGLELIVVSLLSRNHPNCCVGVFYRPPSSQLHIFKMLFFLSSQLIFLILFL